MKPRGSFSFAAFRRSYATRRPERPPPKVADPLLTSPNTTVSNVSGGMTFIHRPPPTAPSVFSTTILPASPLLNPPIQPSPTSPTPTSIQDSQARTVPPRMRKARTHNNRVLTEEDFVKMRKLRAADPTRWTRSALAKGFECPPFLVAQKVPLDTRSGSAALARREEEHEANRSSWGERKSMVMAIRKKRREFW